MDTLRVPKHRTSVEVVQADGSSRAVAVFLADSAEGHDGPERLSDLLARETGFIPAIDAQTERVVCLNLAGVALVRAAPEADAGEVPEHTIPTEHEVDVVLADGRVVHGLICYVQPPERSRLVDFLNDSRPFLRLIEGDRVVLVNKRHVARVVPGGR